MSDEEQRDQTFVLADVVDAWYTDGTDGEAVLTDWLLIAKGTGFGEDGGQTTHVLQAFSADDVTKLGLMEYMRAHTANRVGGGDR